jgi:hypothetical protein
MEQCAIKIASAVFACLLLSVGFYQAASAMEIGPLEVSRYEDITAFRFGNIAFWLRTRTLVMYAVIMGLVFAFIGIVAGIFSGIITMLITVPLAILVGEIIYVGLTILLQLPNAYGARSVFEAYMTSPALSRMSTAEFFYWLNMRAAGVPLPKEIADAFNQIR